MPLQSITNIPKLNSHLLGFCDPSSAFALQQTSKNLKQVVQKNVDQEKLKAGAISIAHIEINEKIQRVIDDLEPQKQSAENFLKGRYGSRDLAFWTRTVLLTAALIAGVACALFFGAHCCIGIAIILAVIPCGMPSSIGIYFLMDYIILKKRYWARHSFFEKIEHRKNVFEYIIDNLKKIKNDMESSVKDKDSRFTALNNYKIKEINDKKFEIGLSVVGHIFATFIFGL